MDKGLVLLNTTIWSYGTFTYVTSNFKLSWRGWGKTSKSQQKHNQCATKVSGDIARSASAKNLLS